MAKKTTRAEGAQTTGPDDRRKVKITLVKSPIGFDRTQGATVQGMGLRRIGHSVELVDTPETRGMILKVRHLVTVQE
ncbi:MAG: 50S ribosomal protein L30 [Acidobacteriota bacterium]|nr:50S ribosomal protein L30 [Acidobacteriota bacterium]